MSSCINCPKFASASTDLPPQLKAISWLVGSWTSSSADGFYPTIKPFKYHEHLSIECLGQPFLVFKYKKI